MKPDTPVFSIGQKVSIKAAKIIGEVHGKVDWIDGSTSYMVAIWNFSAHRLERQMFSSWDLEEID